MSINVYVYIGDFTSGIYINMVGPPPAHTNVWNNDKEQFPSGQACLDVSKFYIAANRQNSHNMSFGMVGWGSGATIQIFGSEGPPSLGGRPINMKHET